MFTANYYVKIFPNKIVARNLSTGKSAEVVPTTPYLHPRLLIGNISSVESALKSALDTVRSNALLAVRILVHPISDFPGGISEAEERLFRQVAYDVRAAFVVLWVGPELSDEAAREKLKSAK